MPTTNPYPLHPNSSLGDHKVAEQFPDTIFRLSPKGCRSMPFDMNTPYKEHTGIVIYRMDIDN